LKEKLQKVEEEKKSQELKLEEERKTTASLKQKVEEEKKNSRVEAWGRKKSSNFEPAKGGRTEDRAAAEVRDSGIGEEGTEGSVGGSEGLAGWSSERLEMLFKEAGTVKNPWLAIIN